MSLQKESKPKIQTVPKKEEKQTQKNLELKTMCSVLRKENRGLKKDSIRLKRSRDNWKAKNKRKGAENKVLKKELASKGKAKGHQYSIDIVSLCIVLRCVCGCSYRKISMIVKILNEFFKLGKKRIPCANTIQNWVSKSGLYHLGNPDLSALPNRVCVIADECYRIGKEKILLVVVCGAEKVKKGALKYSDLTVCFLKAKLSWTSVEIGRAIKQWAKKGGFKVEYMISDEDSRLKSAARETNIVHFPDISHLLSTCLRRAFDKRESYQEFLKILSRYRLKCYKSALNWLRPPTLRNKARFMNQDGIVHWGRTLLSKMHKLRTSEKAELNDLNKELKGCRAILKSLHNCLQLSQRVSKLFKENGLSNKSIEMVSRYMSSFKAKSEAEKVFLKNLQSYMDVYSDRIPKNSCYNVCSDVIESLFGIHKSKIGKGAPSGLSVMALETPLRCSNMNLDADFKLFLESSKMANLSDWKNSQGAENQERRRRKFFEK